MPASTRHLATSLIKALDVLGLVARHPDGLTVQDMGAMLPMPRTSILRVLVTLEHYGLVERSGRLFVASGQFRSWVSGDPDRLLREKHHAALESICAKTQELTVLGVLDGAKLRHVDFVEGPHAIRVDPQLSLAHPLETAAMGKLYLSQRADLARKVKDARVRREVEEAAETGMAWNREESAKDLIAVATWAGKPSPSTPVISISWPRFRYTEEKALQAIRIIRRQYPQR